MNQTSKPHSGCKTVSPLMSLLFIVLCISFIGCDVQIDTLPSDKPSQPTTVDCPTKFCGQTDGVKLFVLPDDGEEVILDAINNAKTSVWVKVYLLTNRDVISALSAAAKSGKDVRVMLEEHPFGGGGLSPRESMDLLKRAKIQAKYSNPEFRFTHEKSMVIDGNAAYIMTLNLTQSAVDRNREYGIIATNPADVKSVKDIFEADWNRTEAVLDNPHIVASPINAREALTTLIQEARETLLVEAETMNDDKLEQELINAVKRGVDVKIVVQNELDADDTRDARKIKNAGAQVKKISSPYMHAKIIVVDNKKAYIGSVNISANSMDNNRELGIIVSEAEVLRRLNETFQKDLAKGKNV